MCGMVGYAGAQAQSALEAVLAGLGRLERAEHDASGVAVLSDGGLAAAGAAGPLAQLRGVLARRPLPTGGTGVGQLRGKAGTGNGATTCAQPCLDAAGRVAVVHDGFFGNRAELRDALTGRGHLLPSGTEGEVAAHLLAEQFSSCVDLGEALRQVCRSLRGSFALIAVHADEPDTVAGVRRGLPLVAGVGDGESFLASDAVAFGGHAHEVRGLPEDHVVLLRREFDEVRCEVTDAHGSVVQA
ncbi:hypothetical protein [Streptomyces sp. MP131-18]|uniref:hypothetical protein n=1 Tax=Streptomyces sp. MP131-18 TaxID=1857892 RepID=UPI00097C3040|nr:hypothetical protein [Streptomyces sp. MP131-18]